MIIRKAKDIIHERQRIQSKTLSATKGAPAIQTPITFPKTTRTLIYYVAFGHQNLKLAEMSTNSLFKAGCRQDIIVFTDRPYQFPHAATINVTKTDKLSILKTRTRPMDYWYMRMCPDIFLNLSTYEKMIYSDTDILFFSSEFIDRFGDIIYVQGDDSDRLNSLNLYQSDETENGQGICDGFYSIPARFYDIFPLWRDAYLGNNRVNDQQAMNYVLFTFNRFIWEMIPITNGNWAVTPRKGKQLVFDTCERKGDAAFAVHYWSTTKGKMVHDYNRFLRRTGEPIIRI